MTSHDIPAGDTDQKEPSASNTAIRVESVDRLRQLQAKLQEYNEREDSQSPVKVLEPSTTYSELMRYFKQTILAYVVNEVESGRDTTSDSPIVITELAVYLHDLDGIHFADAVTTPFVYDANALAYRPDFRSLQEKGSAFIDRAFSEAYAIIMSYANDGGVNVGGGTGLSR